MTIVVIIILASISINGVFGENGILKKTKEVKEMQSNSVITEEEEMNFLLAEYANMMATDSIPPVSINETEDTNTEGSENTNSTGGTDTEEPDEVIGTTTSYVGYYADIDEDKEPDGVIYADLAFSVSGQWGSSDEAFSYSAITGTKDYYVSKTNHEGDFGTKDVLTATGSGADRFYVMALDDFTTSSYSTFYWYKSMWYNGPSTTVTSTSFGTGKTNTSTMISKWNSSTYGTKNSSRDMWGVIQDKVADGWFVPSNEEWLAFGYNIGTTSSNYSSYGLLNAYWSSSDTYNSGWLVMHSGCKLYEPITEDTKSGTRLSATF